LLKHLQEFGKYIAIAGFRNVKIEDVDAFLERARNSVGKNVEIQFFDAELVASWQHLYFAALNALKAFENRGNISKSLGVEVLLYASAQRQIRKATELLGVKKGLKDIAVLMIGMSANEVKAALNAVSKVFGGRRDDEVLELSQRKKVAIRRFFEISEAEIEAAANGKNLEKALIDLVIERMALLATER